MVSRTDRATAVGVYLERGPDNPVRVGTLLRDGGGNVSFVVDESYVQRGPDRPILSVRWAAPGSEAQTVARLLSRNDKIAHAGFLPPWFAGLLPEGALRELVEQQLGTGRHDDFDVIRHLGHDLPGAIVVRDDSESEAEPRQGTRIVDTSTAPSIPRVRFSLAGVQLKFSMRMAKDKLTIPARNERGDVIVKLPNERYPAMPEAEFSAMKLAEAAGIDIAEVDLIPTKDIEGLPERWLSFGERALMARRFDRSSNGRIHIEDFAQIIGAVDDRKYTMANDETIMKIARRFSKDSTGSVLQVVRRIAVNVLLGNHDAHLKNWSMIYRDPTHAELAPAYDILPSAVYLPESRMALEFASTRDPTRITLDKFKRVAKFVDMDPRALVREVQSTVQRAAELWPGLLASLPLLPAAAKVLSARWRTLALTHAVADPFARGQRA